MGETGEIIIQQDIAEKTEHKKPWETVKHPADEYGFSRTEYKFTTPLTDKVQSVIFVDLRDKFITPTTETAIVSRNTKGILNFVQDVLHQDVPQELRLSSPVWQPLKREVVESLAASSLFKENGEHKEVEDNEGPALLLGWLAYRDSNPEMSKSCFDELTNRRKYLSNQEITPEINLPAKLGEIPIENVYSTHTTNYLPYVDSDGARILPRVDTDNTPRWTIHTYINGMVEGHDLGGLLKTSWENQKYLIGMKFQDVVSQNGLPANFFKADTFWSIEPGKGLEIPKGSFIIVPDNEIEKMGQYKNLGFEIVTYNSQNETLRDATKHHMENQNIPFIENISAKDPGEEDRLFANEMGVKSTTHFNLQKYSDSERTMINAQRTIENGEKLTADGEGKLSWEEAQAIALTSDQEVTQQHQPKKFGLALSLRNAYRTLTDRYFNKEMPKEALITAFASEIL
jgi:hypothetical protein